MQGGVALWDVVHRCERVGSLDSAIVKDSVEANDFNALLAAHCSLQAIVFNGAAAETLFRRHVTMTHDKRLVLLRLPSTSPAHAAVSQQDKIQAWAVIQPYLRA